MSAPQAGPIRLRFRGPIDTWDAADRAAWLNRESGPRSNAAALRERTTAIIDRVRAHGDRALRELMLEFDTTVATPLEVQQAACRDALAELDGELRQAMERGARNIRCAHEAFRPVATEVNTEPG